MDRTERFYKIDQLLHERRVVPVGVFLDQLGVSLATFKRDLEYLRDRLNAPIEWDRDAAGYRYAAAADDGPAFSLPGLWLNASEAHALLAMQQLLAGLEPGWLERHVGPLRARLKALLGLGEHAHEDVERRFRILHAARRPLPTQWFGMAASATLKRRRLRLRHYNRGTGETSERDISPQRLVYYRDNWYLDAWCHLRDGIRSFAVDAIARAELLDAAAVDVPEAQLEAALASGYGIFGGEQVAWAQLKFSPARARWVAAETWHPQQQASVDADGAYLLSVPYSDDRELVMDILKHGAEVEVLEPEGLRRRVAEELRAALDRYSG